MLRPSLIAALIALPGIVAAQDRVVQDRTSQNRVAQATPIPDVSQDGGTVPQRIRNVTLSGTQKCPASTDTEIIVCSTVVEPYRIPRQLRDEDAPKRAVNQSWVNRTAVMDDVSRVAGGLPDTCSPVGTGGQSGCALQANRAYAADRRAQARAAESVP